MKIALIGYGKMGKAIEKVALAQGHEVVLRIDQHNLEALAQLKTADVAIEFTGPESAVDNLIACFENGVPVVCGSTGWMQHLLKVETACAQQNGALLYASNFSIGVNLFFEVNKQLAALMAAQPQYAVSMQEVHHTQKKDAPSGTAISLAEQIMAANPNIQQWVNKMSDDASLLGIESIREDPAPGTHTIRYSSAIDDIVIEHKAHNREGFAAGAVLAAQFLCGKKGIYSMKDVLGL
jgi:4-hydroxy-tetrahydrodipicolinate reductase